MTASNYPEWLFEVDRQFRLRTQRSCKELQIAKGALYAAFEEDTTPQEFVTQWIELNGLMDFTAHANH